MRLQAVPQFRVNDKLQKFACNGSAHISIFRYWIVTTLIPELAGNPCLFRDHGMFLHAQLQAFLGKKCRTTEINEGVKAWSLGAFAFCQVFQKLHTHRIMLQDNRIFREYYDLSNVFWGYEKANLLSLETELNKFCNGQKEMEENLQTVESMTKTCFSVIAKDFLLFRNLIIRGV